MTITLIILRLIIFNTSVYNKVNRKEYVSIFRSFTYII